MFAGDCWLSVLADDECWEEEPKAESEEVDADHDGSGESPLIQESDTFFLANQRVAILAGELRMKGCPRPIRMVPTMVKLKFLLMSR